MRTEVSVVLDFDFDRTRYVLSLEFQEWPLERVNQEADMRIWMLFTLLLIVAVLASETLAKKPGKEVDSKRGYEKKKRDVAYSKEGKLKNGEDKKLQSRKRRNSASEENNVESYAENAAENEESSRGTNRSRNKKLKEKETVDPKDVKSKHESKKRNKYSGSSQEVHQGDSRKSKNKKLKEKNVEEQTNLENEKRTSEKVEGGKVAKPERAAKEGKRKKAQKKEKEITAEEEVEEAPIEEKEEEPKAKSVSKKDRKKAEKNKRKRREISKNEEENLETLPAEEESAANGKAKSCSVAKPEEVENENCADNCDEA